MSIRNNIAYSFVEKIIVMGGQFVVLSLYVRCLPLSGFGKIGIATGIMALVNIANLGIEPAIVRGRSIDGGALQALGDTILFNLCKIGVLGMGIIGMAAFYRACGDSDFAWALLAVATITLTDTFVAPFVTYANSALLQSLSTRATLVRTAVNSTLTLVLLYRPEISIVLAKELVVSVCYILIWLVFFKASFPEATFQAVFQFDKIFSRWDRHLRSLAIWTHLNGVATGLVARLDILMLSWFATVADVGKYNVALSVGGLVNNIHLVLSSQNWIALGRIREPHLRKQMSLRFSRLSIWICAATFVGYPVIAMVILRILIGPGSKLELLIWSCLIAWGASVGKTFASPLLAYAQSMDSVPQYVLRISAPLVAVAAIFYFSGAMLAGGRGAAISNLAVGIAWAGLCAASFQKIEFPIPGWNGFSEDLRRVFIFFKGKV